MQRSLGSFRAALLIGLVALSAAGWLYAREKNIPAWAAIPIAAAFLVEYLFYLVPGFESVRARIESRLPPVRLAVFLSLAGLLPYLIYSTATGQFRWMALVSLILVVAGVSFWYVVFPGTAAADLSILILLASILLGRFFHHIYTSPIKTLPLDFLGHVMLVRTGILVMLLLRRVKGTGFGFIPSKRDLAIGLRYFLFFLPIGVPLAWRFGLLHPRAKHPIVWQAAAIVLGIFWVVALSEEFFFRGILQQWLTRWTQSGVTALAISSVCFGLVHLPFRMFPNWRLAIVAAIAGWFYGLAFRKAGSVRASMVSHALVASTWRVFFS